jgi:ABC-2 type transport system permease protein
VLGPLFPFIEDSIAEMMALMPPELMSMVGNVDMSTPQGWLSGEMYSIMAPAAVIYVAIASGSKAFAGEMEAGSMGLLVVNAVSRTRIAFDKAVALLIHVSLTALLTGLGVWLGIVIADLPVAADGVVAITLHLALLGTATGALAMLVAVMTGRRMLALLVAAGVAFVAYIWASFLPLADALAGVAGLSPWFHYNASDPLLNGIDWISAAILAAISAVLLGVGISRFQRRDLAG